MNANVTEVATLSSGATGFDEQRSFVTVDIGLHYFSGGLDTHTSVHPQQERTIRIREQLRQAVLTGLLYPYITDHRTS